MNLKKNCKVIFIRRLERNGDYMKINFNYR